MSNIQQTIDKRIEEKNRKAERIKESSAKGYYVKTAKYSKTPVEDIKFNCRYFIAEQTAYTGTISDLTGTVLTFDNVDSGDGGSYTATGTYYCSGFSWVTNIWAGYYLKCNGGYFRIESNTADTLTFREEIDITPASADWEIVPFISNSMYNAELNPNTGQDEVFTIKSNTDTTITVAPSGSILLTDVASVTDTFEVKKYYAPRIEDFDDQGAGTIQSKIVDAPFGKLVDKNMGAHFAGVYSVRLLCFNSKSFQIKLDVPDSLRVVETQGDDENVLLDSRFGQNTANVLALNFTASVWKRLDFFYYTSRGDYGFTIEGLNDPIGNYVDAWSDVTPDAPSNVVATGYTCKIKITWVNTGLIGTGGGTQIYRSTSEGGTYTFVNFVPWDGNEYTDAGLDGETTYYYKLKSRNNRGDLSDYSSVVNATTLPEVGDPGYALRIACVSGSHSIDGNNAYYKSGDVLSITISSPVALTAAPTVTVAGEAASFVSSTHEYTNCIYTYTIAGTEDEGTQAIVASGTGKEGGTTISGTANIFLDFVAPTVTGTPIIISADDDLKTGDQYAYHADKIWVFTTDDLVDTSGDPAETSGLNRIYLQNAFVGTSTAVGSGYLTDSVLASIFANDYWNNYYLTDSAGTTRQIIDYVGASGQIAMIGTPAAGAYYITKYPIATITSWRNYDVSNRQVIIWNLTLDMPYTTATIPDTITLSTNHKYRVIAKITDQSLNASALCYDDIYLDQTAPGVVTGLTATGDIQSIILKFTTPGAIDLDRINIYMNTSAGIAVDNVPTNYVKMYCMADAIPNKASEFVVYFDEPEELTRYFVCTAVDKSGREGVCSSEVSAATLPHWGKLFRNYFDNGSFERLASAEVPVNWTRHGSATVEQDPQFGDNCIEINSEVNYYSYDYLWLPANPDTYFFTFSIYAKYIAPDTDADVLFDFIWYDRNGDAISKTSLGIGGGNGFYDEDDFEGGDFAKWDAVGSDWSVQDAVVISGDYSAQCDVTAWESEDAKLEKSGVWKNFTIEGDIRVNQKYGVCQKATIGGRSDGTGWIYYGLSMRPGDGGHFQYYDGTAFYNFPNDKTWDVDTVYHFKITYDFTNSIQYTWVDGFYLGERSMKDGHGVLLNDNRYFEKVSIFGSSGWESGHDYLYADNIEIYKTTHEYTNCIYTYTIAGTEDEGTQAIVASGTGKEGGTTISGTANIFLDFVAPTVTGTPIIISADDDLKTGDQYAYHADKIWVFTTDDLVDTSGDPAETSGLNRIYLQNAFVGTSTAVGSGYLTDSVLASIFANDYWNNYYLTDSAGTTRQIIDYVGASGQIAMIGTPAAGAYYITKYPIATITSWRNYDVSNRQVIIWNLTLDMPYTTATIPDTITLSTNHKYRVIAKITDQSLNASALCYDDIYLDQTAPGVVTGLTATGDIQSIILKFTTPGAIDLDRINIYMNTSAGIAVDNVPTNYVKMYCMADAIPNKASEFVVYFDEPEELTRYFVCTAVDKSGREGVCSSEVSAATLPHWGKLFRNYFDNGSFERLASAEVPVNWTRHGSATVEQDPQFGDNCIEINSEVNYYSYDYLWLPANPDTYFFTFSIYAKYIAPDTDADVLFDFIWYDRNGDAISKTSLGIGGGNGFYDEDDFEGGDFAKWDAVGSDWSVQDAVVISGDYSAQCDVTAWESEDAKLEKSGVWKNFTIEGDIRVNQKYGVCQKATIGGRSDGTGWIYYGLSMRPGDGGHFQYYDGTAFYNFPNDKTWDVDTVYHFKITYDFTNSIQYTWVDGFYLGERSMKDGHGVLLNDNRYFEKVSIFGSSGWESGHDYLYVDNIEIYKTTHEYTNGFYDEDDDEALVLTDSYARYHTYFGSGYNEIPSNADYVFIKIMGLEGRVAHADAVQWEETSSGGMMPTAFVNNRVDSGQRAMYKYIRGSMIEADTLTTDLIRIGAQTSIYSGTLSSTAYNSVTWATGYLKVGGETYTITGSSHASLTASTRYYLYFDKNTSTTTFQITLTQSTAYGDDKVLIAIVDTGAVFNYAASITPMHSSGTIINGSQIRTGEIASHDEKTKFDLDGDQIVINETVDRVILGKTATGKYGIKIYDASGNLIMQVDDDDQLLQSADTKSYVDLKNSEIGMNDGGGNEVIINPTEGLIGKHNSYKTFDVGATTGRAFFRGGVMSGRMSCIPLYATAFGLDKTDTGIAEIKIDDDSWDFGNGVIVGETCYLNGYIYVCISGDELTYYVPIIGKINCITNAFTWEPILSMADAGTIGGICTDGTYIWVAASVDTNDDLVEDTVKVYKISPTTLEIIASYAIDAPANLATPLEMCYDGTYLWIADFTDANHDIIYFKISDQTDGVVALTYESSCVCFDGTYIWAGEYGAKLGKIDPATKALTEYNHNGWGGVCFDGTHVWAANANVITPQVKKIDPSSPTTALATISTSAAPFRMVFDGRLMFVCCHAVVDVIDIFTNTKLGTDKSSAFAFYICFDGLNFWESGWDNTNYVTKIPH